MPNRKSVPPITPPRRGDLLLASHGIMHITYSVLTIESVTPDPEHPNHWSVTTVTDDGDEGPTLTVTRTLTVWNGTE